MKHILAARRCEIQEAGRLYADVTLPTEFPSLARIRILKYLGQMFTYLQFEGYLKSYPTGLSIIERYIEKKYWDLGEDVLIIN